MRLQHTLAVSSAAVACARAKEATCKCAPDEPCWPSLDDWHIFNSTINGALIAAELPARVCYPGDAYNKTACELVHASWFDSNFHAAHPISVDSPTWANNSCSPIFPNGTSITGDRTAGSRGCTQGNYALYAVNATSPEIISTTLKWATKKNIRISIKNTGHSFTGRSIEYGSLEIWTHHYRSFDFHEDWKAKDCPASNSTEKQMAATFGAAMQDRDALALTHEHGAVVVTGSNPTVGLMGWFPAGGHGPLSASYGMGADNVLEVKNVTPKGELLTANECQNTDLFWAVLGGGPGTFGVIVEATLKAYPIPQTTISSLTVTQLPATGNVTSQWWKMMADFHAKMPALKDGGAQGYYDMTGPPLAPSHSLQWFTYNYDTPNSTVDAIYKPVLDLLDNNSDLANYTFKKYSAPSFYEIWNASTNQGFEPVATGGGWSGSRLLTRRALIEDVELVARTFEIIGSTGITVGHFIANSANRGLDIALHPGWRDTVIHLVTTQSWGEGSPREVKDAIKKDMQENKIFALKQLSPESGAYMNEADPEEKDWQFNFFGVNYPRLRWIKERYDPEGVLWCRSCVGSEDWVEQEDGRLCRPEWW